MIPILTRQIRSYLSRTKEDGLLPTFGNSWTLSITTLAAIGLIIYLLLK